MVKKCKNVIFLILCKFQHKDLTLAYTGEKSSGHVIFQFLVYFSGKWFMTYTCKTYAKME